MNRHDDALTAAEESVDLFRELADRAPESHTPDLARALNTYAARLGEVNRHDDALTATEESLDLFRELADRAPRLTPPAWP